DLFDEGDEDAEEDTAADEEGALDALFGDADVEDDTNDEEGALDDLFDEVDEDTEDDGTLDDLFGDSDDSGADEDTGLENLFEDTDNVVEESDDELFDSDETDAGEFEGEEMLDADQNSSADLDDADIFGEADAEIEDADLFEAIEDEDAEGDDILEGLFEEPEEESADEEEEDDLDELFNQTDPADETQQLVETNSAAKEVSQRVVVVDVTGPKSVSMRRWIDDTGLYSTMGTLVEIRHDAVRLLKNNGRHTTVSWDRLSDLDKSYVHSVASLLDHQDVTRLAER
ncbi:MAG: hypothetical protein MK179_16070, partial [Pirellulaceae bacterium]|nr:hypothetical protein [Pirellulaceae bacterium]